MRRGVLFGVILGCAYTPDPVPYVLTPVPGAHSPNAPHVAVQVPTHAQKVCQMIGDVDLQTRTRILNQTSGVGVLGTDLGIPVQWGNNLVFLFGDTYTSSSISRPDGSDGFATLDVRLTPSEACDRLAFVKEADGGFDPITLDGHTLPGHQVPTGAFPGHLHLFAFFTIADEAGRTIGDGGGRGVLGRSSGNGHFETVRVVSPTNDRFNMVVAALGPPNIAALPGDWDDHETVLLFGTGHYRESFPRLALMQRNHVDVPWIYYAGLDASGAPIWAPNEESAMPLFPANSPANSADECVGEMSVAYAPHIGHWLMTYNCRNRIIARTARDPWGPWSQSVSLFIAPFEAWGTFIHHPCSGGDRFPCGDEDYSPWQGAGMSGSVYGPYLIPQWFTSNRFGQEDIVFTMSTWNPYTSVLMKATIELPTDLEQRDRSASTYVTH